MDRSHAGLGPSDAPCSERRHKILVTTRSASWPSSRHLTGQHKMPISCFWAESFFWCILQYHLRGTSTPTPRVCCAHWLYRRPSTFKCCSPDARAPTPTPTLALTEISSIISPRIAHPIELTTRLKEAGPSRAETAPVRRHARALLSGNHANITANKARPKPAKSISSDVPDTASSRASLGRRRWECSAPLFDEGQPPRPDISVFP